MNQTGRELFNNNKVTEAICQFTFKENLEQEFVDKFYELIKVKYSASQDVPKFHLNINSNNVASQIHLKGIKASNLTGDKVVQIFNDNVSVHQIGNYQTWEKFSEDIFFILNKLKEVTNSEIVRIDLRVINKFVFESDFNSQDYFNISIVYPNEYIQNSNYQYNLEQIYEPEKKAGVIRAFCTALNDEINFILDLSYINWLFESNLKVSDVENIKDSLEDGHNKLYTLFSQSITNKTKHLIK